MTLEDKAKVIEALNRCSGWSNWEGTQQVREALAIMEKPDADAPVCRMLTYEEELEITTLTYF